MKGFDTGLTMFGKGIKAMWKGILVIYAIQVGYYILMFFFRGNIPRVYPNLFQRFLINLGSYLFYLYSLFLLFSLYKEKQERPALSTDRFSAFKGLNLLYKFLIVFFAMLLNIAFLMFYTYTVHLSEEFRVDPRLVAHGFVHLFSEPFIALCLVCTVWGVIQAVDKYRHLVAVGTGVAGFVLYSSVKINLYSKFRYVYPDKYLLFMQEWGLEILAITLMIGTLYFVVGLIFYNRFADM